MRTQTSPAIRALLLFVAVLSGCQQPGEVPEYPIMGSLQTGEYAVGYRTLFTHDQTRDGWSDDMPGRPHQINTWYPAKAETGRKMIFADYLELLDLQQSFERDTGTARRARQLYIEATRNLGGDSFGEEQLDLLSQLAVTAFEDADAEPGKFPVLLMAYGTGPSAMSITAEYLASHGFVVVGFVSKGPDGPEFEVSTKGLEAAADDLEFALSQAARLPNTDMTNVCLLANAIHSSVCAVAASRNSRIRALISLEGGLPSRFEQMLLQSTSRYEPHSMQLPMLFIYAPHSSIDPEHTEHLRYSKRYYAHFPEMSEFLMLNYGMFNSFVPNIIGEYEGDIQRGFEVANELMLRFLREQTMGQGPAFEEAFLVSAENVIDTTFIWEAAVAPPTMSEMKQLYLDRGFAALDSTYHYLKSGGNVQPFSLSTYKPLGWWIGWSHDEDFEDRLALYRLAYDSYPKSVLVNYYLAYFLRQRGMDEEARKHYRRVLDLLPGNNDPHMGEIEIERIQGRAMEAIGEL